jgi:parallel beta-helix repeat protein
MVYHNANYNTIRENNISTIAIEGIQLQDQVSYNTIADNDLINCSVGIKLLGPNYSNVISGNFLAKGQSGIRIQNARYTEIFNNMITQNYGGEWDAGIRLDNAADSIIHSNLIVDNWRGILLYTASPRVLIYNNNITRNEFGVRVASGGSNYLNISGNVVMHNRGYGVGLTGFTSGSHYATISRNTLINNSDGIALGQYSNYNTICQNNISENNYGFFIEYSTQNMIYRNNIVGNDQQVYLSTGSVNSWNQSYPFGGNYWSDYTGEDMYSGEHQDLLGSDGIGDNPYIIDADNQDNYPFMEPLGPHDVAVQAVTLSKSIVGQGYNLYANVTVTNQGHNTEASNVTLYANATALETREVVLSAGNSIILVFAWNTSAFAYGNYTIWAYMEPVSGEAYTVDNTYVAGMVTITIQGDVDGDGDVDIFDIVKMAGIYGVEKPAPEYEANCDLDGDGDIDIFDVVKAATNYGKNW